MGCGFPQNSAMTPDELAVKALLPSGDAIFLHRPHGRPCDGITPEVISDFDWLTELLLRNPEARKYQVPQGLTFVTYSNYKSMSRIEQCYEAHGIRDYVVLGRDIMQWDWSAKVGPLLDYLESGACLTPYVLCTDALDVLMVRDPAPLLERFRTYSCDVLFCNTFVDYPPNKECRDFESLTYYASPLHCRLSAGAFAGEKEALLVYVRQLVEAYRDKAPWAICEGRFEDQLGWRYLHCRHYPKIQVDFRSQIFKRYDLFRDLE